MTRVDQETSDRKDQRGDVTEDKVKKQCRYNYEPFELPRLY